MKLLKSMFNWVRYLFPFTHDGRQTLMYLTFAGSGPVVTICILWAMDKSLNKGLFKNFESLSWILAVCLLIIHLGVATFVSFRAFRITKTEISLEGRDIED